ncbi:hypothetical protein GH714_035521 [Hevea brasiliensis]|uniref:Uncharacterized protein n=1 Tax=Hevea brasiliensis TaxID=3981 RepID=A0A6A6KVJ3_HEVBR|nr:hypothetical protein GH714_035521 [Hevea brasiliensis]
MSSWVCFFKPSGSCIDQNSFANDPSNSSSLVISYGIEEYIVEENDGGEGCSLNEAAPVMHQASSVVVSGLRASVGLKRYPSNHRITEYIVEENNGGEVCSLDGMCLYYKKRSPKDEQLGARCVLALEAAPIMHQPSSVVASGLEAGVGPSDIHQTIGVNVEYIVEENDGGKGCSLDGKHLYCKRRALEDEQLGARLMVALEVAHVMH